MNGGRRPTRDKGRAGVGTVCKHRFSARLISNFGILSVPKARLGLRLLGACARRIPPAAHGHRWATMDVNYTTYAHFKRPPLQTLDCVLMHPLMKGPVVGSVMEGSDEGASKRQPAEPTPSSSVGTVARRRAPAPFQPSVASVEPKSAAMVRSGTGLLNESTNASEKPPSREMASGKRHLGLKHRHVKRESAQAEAARIKDDRCRVRRFRAETTRCTTADARRGFDWTVPGALERRRGSDEREHEATSSLEAAQRHDQTAHLIRVHELLRTQMRTPLRSVDDDARHMGWLDFQLRPWRRVSRYCLITEGILYAFERNWYEAPAALLIPVVGARLAPPTPSAPTPTPPHPYSHPAPTLHTPYTHPTHTLHLPQPLPPHLPSPLTHSLTTPPNPPPNPI